MSKIKISDLHPSGSELFFDSEGYMNDLVDGEISDIYGGATPSSGLCISAISVRVVASITVVAVSAALVTTHIRTPDR